MQAGEILLISVFIGISEILRFEMRRIKSFKSLMIFLGVSTVIVSLSLFVTWEVLVGILAIFIVHLYFFLRGCLSEVLVEQRQVQEQGGQRRVDLWKVMKSPVFPSYDRDIVLKLVSEVAKIGG